MVGWRDGRRADEMSFVLFLLASVSEAELIRNEQDPKRSAFFLLQEPKSYES